VPLFEGLRRRFGSGGEAITFHAYHEIDPGPRWEALFEATWPAYHEWFLREGDAARPSYLHCRRALREHMPELVPSWEALVDLAGGGDAAARMLSLWCPPRFIAGCSQVTLRGSRGPALVRNYDYAPSQFEGVIASTGYVRRVAGSSDCLWGLLDGVNDAGLAASLTFGGRPEHGEGFGIALVLRYLLETCETAAQAAGVLERLPVHFSYNVMLLDDTGHGLLTYVRPDRPAVTQPRRVATNHQESIEWQAYAEATHTQERETHLRELLAEEPPPDEEQVIAAFLHEPLYGHHFDQGFGTLYTAVLRPEERGIEYRWPEASWEQRLDSFEEGERTVMLRPRAGGGRLRVPWRALQPVEV
jgi:predicted choloylglycine hydrolase